MNETLNKIVSELKQLQTAERKYLKAGEEAGTHSYLVGIGDAIDMVHRYIEDQTRDDIRQGRNEI